MPTKEEHFGKGLTLYERDKYEEAIDIYPQDPMYHTSLSTVYRDMGRTSDAEEELAASFQLQRGH